MRDIDIYNMPKVDLHVHLSGCFQQSELWQLAQKHRPEMGQNQFNKIFDFHNFEGFSFAWKFKNSLIKTYDDFSFLMDGVVDHIKKDNIVYWEPAIALFELKSLDPAQLLDIAATKLDNSGIHYSFIMDLIRGDGKDEIQKQYNFYHSHAKDYKIRGVGLAGNEAKHGLPLELAPIFQQAKADGYGISIHAGETINNNNISQAIEVFGADRIGHALHSLYSSEDSVKKIVRDNIHLEFILSAQMRWGKDERQAMLSIDEYLKADVLNRMYDVDIPILDFSINSDDPGMFGRSLSEVFSQMNSQIHCKEKDFKLMMNMANDAS
ncbi:MAG: hypothetical protein LBL47_01930, partial [Lactobacillus sp.]|nr:hypothetical protein [Lactobacillus sp.]